QCDWMIRYPDPHGAGVPVAHPVREDHPSVHDEGESPGPVRTRQLEADTFDLSQLQGLLHGGDEDADRASRRTALELEQTSHRFLLERDDLDPIDGVGRQPDHTTGTNDIDGPGHPGDHDMTPTTTRSPPV